MKIFTTLLLFVSAINCNGQLKPVESGVFHWADLVVKKDGLRESRKIASGTTAEFDYFEIHATTQMKGAVPKPAHTQKDIEELIIIKEGSMKCTVGKKIAVLDKGSVLLIPPGEAQVFENIGEGPLTYYVFQFRSKKMNMERSNAAGGSLLLHADSLAVTQSGTKSAKKYFERPTAMCDNYEMHVTTLNVKGPSHAAHTHFDTEILLLIQGEAAMTIDGKQFTGGAGDIFIANSNSLHFVENTSNQPCSYFAFKWR